METKHHSEDPEKIFVNLNAETQEVSELESLCMNCHEQGTTRLMMTIIPHFKEILLMAFECPHCGFRNNEIQNAHTIPENGVNYHVLVNSPRDLNRQIVKGEKAHIFIPDLEFEIPPSNGELNTIEGFLQKAIDDLSYDQEVRKKDYPETHAKIEEFIGSMTKLVEGKVPFSLILDDPSGNSYIEAVAFPENDPNLTVKRYKRSSEQNHKLGIFTQGELAEPATEENAEGDSALQPSAELPPQEVMVFPGTCSSCHRAANTNMQVVNIPYFKDTIIMATSCTFCGFKSNEVRAGGAISEKGRKISLKITGVDDFNRDILKSETAALLIPEIDLELTYGTLGGRFTTIEGLLTDIKNDLENKGSFMIGDSAESKRKCEDFFGFLNKALSGEIHFTLVLDDPFANSYIQNPYAPDVDPNMEITDYERSFEQNEAFGINDMKTD